MEFFSQKSNFNFMRYRWPFIIVSLVLVALSFYAWVARGTDRFGVDFLGGSEVIVDFENEVAIDEVRKALEDQGVDGAVVQAFSQGTSEFSIRFKAAPDAGGGAATAALRERLPNQPFKVIKEDFIGPLIGEEIRNDGLIALALCVLGILVYVSVRFEFRFAAGGVVALVHDVIVAAGIYLLVGGEITTGTLAALLALLGFSINDTIVVFDRIRENMAKALKTGTVAKKQERVAEMRSLINLSVNETLSRTIITNLTALISATALWLFGGPALADFSLPLTIGIVAGTYSSIFIASPVVLAFEHRTIAKQSAAA